MALALMLALVISLLGGCAGKNANTSANSASNEGKSSTAGTSQTQNNTAKTMKIGLIPQSTLFVFYDYVKKGADDAAAKAGYKINYQGTTTDTNGSGQRQIVEDMITSGIDALAISATNPDAVNDLLKSLKVPVVAWDCSVDSSACATTVSVDHYKAAAAAADYMIKKVPDGGKFAVLSTNAGNAVIQQREKGFMETLTSRTLLYERRFGKIGQYNAGFAQCE